MTRVLLLRHGQTAGNALRRYIGRTDEPLCPAGVSAADAAGKDDERKTVYVTPLLRTQQTARLLFPNAEQVVVPELREMDFGDFEGRTADEMVDDAAYRAWVDGNCQGRCPNGESTEGFCARVCAGFESLLRSLQDTDPCPAFVVHGGVIMALMARFAVPAVSFYASLVRNCEGYLCDVGFAPELRLLNTRRVKGAQRS